MKNNYYLGPKFVYHNSRLGALLPIALFLIVSIASIVPFLIHNSEQSAERGIYNGEWAKIQWGLNGLRYAHASKLKVEDELNPSGATTIATISYGDFHVTAKIMERKTLMGKNECFSMTPMVYRGPDPYHDAGYNLDELTLTYDSVPGVAAGDNTSFAWKKDGNLYAWGENGRGQLGVGTESNENKPKLVVRGTLDAFTDVTNFNQGWLVSSGNKSTLAVDYSGQLYVLGKYKYNSRLLSGSDEFNLYPDKLNTVHEILDVASGEDYITWLAKDGKVYKRSWNSRMTTNDNDSEVPGLSDVIGIVPGQNHLLAFNKNGELWGYGSNQSGQLTGNSTSSTPARRITTKDGLPDFSSSVTPKKDKYYDPEKTSFTINEQRAIKSLAVDMKNDFRKNINYTDYILLRANDPNNTVKVYPTSGGKKWTYIKDEENMIVLEPDVYEIIPMTLRLVNGVAEEIEMKAEWKADYKTILWFWETKQEGGYSFVGEYVNTIENLVGAAAGDNFSIAIDRGKNKDIIYSWGTNDQGQLGLGNNNTRRGLTAIPDFLPNGQRVRSIVAGGKHVLCLLDNGDVYSWGNNSSGQLGYDNTTNSTNPKKITSLSNIISIAAGKNHSLAMDEDFKVYSWGQNNYGQLGNNSNSSNAQTTPITITLN